jgi:arylsulfatase A-like enzyme
LFVIHSDHGEGLDSHPYVWRSYSHGRVLYESNVRVPLILYHPAWRIPPARVDRMVRLMDVMPTILDFVGAPIPEDIEGRSLLPLFDGSGGPVDLPDYVITETEYQDFEKLGVYSAAWKYFDNRDEHPGTNRFALQAVGKPEIGRRTDQIAQHQEEAARLRAYLEGWEGRFPKMPATPMTEALSPEMREQLEAIGYIN